MTARRIVVTFAAVTVAGWLLVVGGVTDAPSGGYVVADLVLDALLVIGLWFLWRPAWIIAVVLTGLGELLFLFSPARHAVLLIVGAAQIALLFLPQLRRELGRV